MRLKLKTPPSLEPVSLNEAKNHLKVDATEDDALISSLITSGRIFVENGTGRALITQTWELYFDSVGEEIEIPKPPLQEVSKIEVVNDAGVKSEVSPSLYDVDASIDSPGRIRLKNGCSWPSHRGFASFIVTFDCGYGDKAEDVPDTLKQTILQFVNHLYENRGTVDIPEEITALYFPYKIMSL